MKRVENQDTSPESQQNQYWKISDAIRRFSDDIFFIQTRHWKGWKKFRAYKIRTMVHDADKNIPIEVLCWTHKKSEDPRILANRKWMRMTWFDELPQVINILKGEMSVFGARPSSEAVYENMTDVKKRRRNKYKPWVFGGYGFVWKESPTRLKIKGKRTMRENQDIYLKWREIKAAKSIIHLSLYHLYVLKENIKAIRNWILK